MKKLKSVVSKMAKNSANLALRRDTTCAAVFQPKVPSSLDKLKKHND